ncbi:MAG: helix-turn-helix domain-containing protein [Lachnospiraceae bacterium]|nr:helix-turn-helix domain-containing protein [Lachnospiraceae bacterium]
MTGTCVNERNATQTARDLFIHRSTLLYRLERIQKLTEVNLDDPKERLVLRVSYYILEERSSSS